ncbi:MAG: MFS transporter [Candidatus Latescibacteria bacterium]|nr:MFS transporter [Candidatus Latescibacterota bacterium]
MVRLFLLLLDEITDEKEDMQNNVHKYYIASFCWQFCLILAISLLYYRDLGLSYTQIGFLWIAMGMASILVEIPAGVFCDFFGRKRTVAIGSLLTAAALLLIGISHSYWMVMVGCAVWGASGAFMSGAVDALIYDSLKAIGNEAGFLKIRSRLSVVQAVAMMSGSILGGYLYQFDRQWPWLAFSLAQLMAAGCVALMKEPYSAEKSSGFHSQLHHIKEACSFAWRTTSVRWLILFASLVFLPTFAFMNLVRQPYLVEIGYKVVDLGYIFALVACISGFGGALSARVEGLLGPAKSLVLMLVGPLVLYAASGLIRDGIGLITVVLLYCCFNFQDAVISAYLNRNIESGSRATVLSLQSFVVRIVQLSFIALAGDIIDRFSISVFLFCLSGFLCAVSIPLVLLRGYWRPSI